MTSPGSAQTGVIRTASIASFTTGATTPNWRVINEPMVATRAVTTIRQRRKAPGRALQWRENAQSRIRPAGAHLGAAAVETMATRAEFLVVRFLFVLPHLVTTGALPTRVQRMDGLLPFRYGVTTIRTIQAL